MDDGLARVMSVTRIQRATPCTGYADIQITNEHPPPRGVLSFAYFSLDEQRKVCFNRQKIFISPRSTTSRGNEERFCESTLEKDGTSHLRAQLRAVFAQENFLVAAILRVKRFFLRAMNAPKIF